MENLDLALTLLVAGFIIVFVMLILLIAIIMAYGKIIQAAQKAATNHKSKKAEEIKPAEPAPVVEAVIEEEDSDEIPGEIIAVIAAAVDAVYGKKSHKIKSVKRSRSSRSAWGNAGVVENTRPF